MSNSVLIELRTEELPPKALSHLGEVFKDEIFNGLVRCQLSQRVPANVSWFATPRRLAVSVREVETTAADRVEEMKLMPVSVALDANGQPTQALRKKLEASGIPVSEIAKFETRMDGKAQALFYKATVKGVDLDAVLAGIVTQALKKLPIQKVMRWGDSEDQFVRPVHSLIMLHGTRVVPGTVLGLTSGNKTLGHRFLSSGDIVIENPEEYAAKLEAGKVIASFAERRASIAAQLDVKAAELNARLNPAEGLLDEVTSLVEWPVVYVGEFEADYLEVPQECLILTMQQNQKYFPLLDSAGKLLNKFLIVSNMQVDDPTNIISGNARVVRPRLSDARFFYNQDRKHSLASRLDRLNSVVYHNKLGSVLQRVDRLEGLARKIGISLGANASLAARAARLAKADLVTDMVGEFPELQGTMGRYYALHDGEDARVADAVESHYQPRFAGDVLPQGSIACATALADKLDALAGFFGIGQIPTGDKDPFGLRRAALGILRILMESPLPLDLRELLADAASGFEPGQLLLTDGLPPGLEDFMLDRLRGLLRDAGYAQDVIEAVLVQRPTRIDLVPARLDAVRSFQALPEALALAAANKRIGNILKKAESAGGERFSKPDSALLQEDAEKALYQRVQEISPVVESHVDNEAYADALQALASVRVEVDHFFDKVMVNVDDSSVRANRLGLLKALFDQLNAVADISKLSV
ncbi:glycine tRNA synthetase, beta subunit [Candidatus Propionivibrio aalborgensis]|uniref:Glycine--tRNA ligase beta subunit n=1 Tax=Candidatus Propionivibrio aalborgensis TaxID=1860101 RepID=A0A1A8Y2K3_9RHOO|nr:glycine--tRNA ligase subunit beta [Candidatus Propionivibrio aalborgensis]MBK7325127.1 glycine--tRNA ligase subunit beta [Propionivibrio sp.]MBK7563610.1 glycine--tRNA ligase subunit beta [Propionivibrio sp.]MBK9028533.1 glycine--tRNA ligase subunit beta [Propionivibrio sp.]MBP6421375.1 glycine--tRNA ligase subunit beta [Propionivibrio sp.]SBT11196.1 glycine tRNA synthetase, beta subunit [Candidatus Propionivibrio aalborgensis]